MCICLIVLCHRNAYFSRTFEYVHNIWYDNFYGGWEYYSSESITITGDSIETEDAGKWSKILRDKVKFKRYNNYAIGGTCLSTFGSGIEAIASDERLDKMRGLGDLILVGTGTNDWGNNTPIGTLSNLRDKNTFIGSLYYLINMLKEKAPNSKIVIMSNTYAISPRRHNFSDEMGLKNNLNLTMEDYADAIKSVCEYCDVDYLDAYHMAGIDSRNYKDNLLHEHNKYGDEVWVHPNDSGAMRIYQCILEYLLEEDYVYGK